MYEVTVQQNRTGNMTGVACSYIIKAYKARIEHPEDSIYWNMTAEYGIRYMKMLAEWCDSCINKLEDDEQ